MSLLPAKPITPQTVVLGTHNIGKVAELKALLAPMGWNLMSATDYTMPQEGTAITGATLYSNATLKAESLCAQTGIWALADDSGLFVEALPDVLGVDTALYGGPAKLLENMSGVPEYQRGAYFRCVVALARPQLPTLLAEGQVTGHIALAQRGIGGFGYDAVFIAEGASQTTAERIDAQGLDAKADDHRGRAVRALLLKQRGLPEANH
jgi:XTP/dITP diphosphohydrolase